jgi:hypothetical protein
MIDPYLPVTPTALRTVFTFTGRGADLLSLRCTLTRSHFEESCLQPGFEPKIHQVIAEQFVWLRLAEAQLALPPGQEARLLPDCADLPHSSNLKRELNEPTALDADQLRENIPLAQESLAQMRQSWPAECRLVETWLGAACKTNVNAIRSALDALPASQSEAAFVPMGSVGFARFLLTRPTFYGCPAPEPRAPRNPMEMIRAMFMGERPGSRDEPAAALRDFEFPEPVHADHADHQEDSHAPHE